MPDDVVSRIKLLICQALIFLGLFSPLFFVIGQEYERFAHASEKPATEVGKDEFFRGLFSMCLNISMASSDPPSFTEAATFCQNYVQDANDDGMYGQVTPGYTPPR